MHRSVTSAYQPYFAKRININAASVAPIIGPTIGTHEYFQSESRLPFIGSRK